MERVELYSLAGNGTANFFFFSLFFLEKKKESIVSETDKMKKIG
jgi:hypothetical protein